MGAQLSGLKPTHPGELLREIVFPALKMPKREIADLLGISRQMLHGILAERHPITPTMALRIGKLLGTSPESWLRMQEAYDLRKAEQTMRKELKAIPTLRTEATEAFADYCLFAMAAPVLQGPGLTVSFGCEFLDAAREGERVEGSGDIMRAGGSMIFLRGVLKSAERPLFTFSGTIKRVKRRMPAPSAGSS